MQTEVSLMHYETVITCAIVTLYDTTRDDTMQ